MSETQSSVDHFGRTVQRVADPAPALYGGGTGLSTPPVMVNVFNVLAEAQIALRHAEWARAIVRAQVEQGLIDEAGGVKNIGPTLTDVERYFRVAFLDEPEVILVEEEFHAAEDALDRAKAAVREYECLARVPGGLEIGS